jgi:hypothetical protein
MIDIRRLAAVYYGELKSWAIAPRLERLSCMHIGGKRLSTSYHSHPATETKESPS